MTKYFFTVATVLSMFCQKVNGQAATKNIRPDIDSIISKLRKEPLLHLGLPVGYGGIPEFKNQYYKLYLQLTAKATNDELVSMANDSIKTIVLYSFLILHSRNYSGLKDIFLNHIQDESEVWIASGCTGKNVRVNAFMLNQLNPSYLDSRQPYITQEEYDKYLRELRQRQ
ncbi:MAG: hypothetical protein QM687_10400 [Ferruginibacter sp.]